jgi:dTDP-4-amino-4,6-dideoxygalactose transaminase
MEMKEIAFNVPYLTGNEIKYIQESVLNGKISGDGIFTKKCHAFFETNYHFKKVLLTTSCTDALEMAAILADIQVGDEIIMPSYTFVSTANAFVLRGAKIVFADSRNDHPGIDEASIESLITPKTKAIVIVHYAGVACNMEIIQDIASRNSLLVIEDAAQAIDSYYKGKPLGSFGDLAAFSFHETKNVMCGEGGMLVINNEKFMGRAEIIREKGTNRSAFFRGEIDKYGWVDIGSSFLPSDILAAFLFAQLENLKSIQEKRIWIWEQYYALLNELQQDGKIILPSMPEFASNNAHMFYILCENNKERTNLGKFLKTNGINAVFHYQSLHKSTFFQKHSNDLPYLKEADRFTDCLLRLPIYFELIESDIKHICKSIKLFYELPYNDR